ncbi:MAG TPA: type II toxin-antitoxin system RelE/ParE family toxin [Planctomycetota bacterium]|nr:type II toxin-antitoxin system RelE/ParE family toxin [Planctomycetota bacterium]
MKDTRLSARAQADLEEIWVYIGQDSPAAADRFVERILQTCRTLARTPRIGRPREDLAPGLRSLPYEKYVIFYRIAKSGVEVARVLSGYRDIEVLFDR